MRRRSRQTYRRTEGWTDRSSYRDARIHLKRKRERKKERKKKERKKERRKGRKKERKKGRKRATEGREKFSRRENGDEAATMRISI